MTLHQCDRCKKIDKSNTDHVMVEIEDGRKWDLCGSCFTDFQLFIANKETGIRVPPKANYAY